MVKKNDHIIVAIGASAGGLQALNEFFNAMPPQDDIAFVVLCHLHRDHRSNLDVLLSRETEMPVIRIDKRMPASPGNIYVLPENKYLGIQNGELVLIERDAGLINKAVDIFFTSLAKDAGSNAVGIVLSGMGTDGVKGATAIEKNGGFVMVQDPASTRFNGMPMSVIRFDHPDVIDTPNILAKFIAEYSFSFRQEQRA